jgi:hypothetical protein
MIDAYLNQTAVWKHVTGNNSYGEPEYSESNIKVRWEGKRQLVRDSQGDEVVSEARLFCKEAVMPGDVMEYGGREWPVITVSVAVDLNGNALFREVAL